MDGSDHEMRMKTIDIIVTGVISTFGNKLFLIYYKIIFKLIPMKCPLFF